MFYLLSESAVLYAVNLHFFGSKGTEKISSTRLVFLLCIVGVFRK